MSALQITQVLEKTKLGTTLQRSASDWLEMLLEAPAPMLLLGAGHYETPKLAAALHRAGSLLLDREGELHEAEAETLLKDLQTYGEQPLAAWEDGTLLITDFDTLAQAARLRLARLLHGAQIIAEGRLLLIVASDTLPTHKALARQLETLCPCALEIPPLYQRPNDIDRQVCAFAQTLLQKVEQPIEGFSLEATAHLHRAVLQTQRDSDELHAFIKALLERASQDRLPLHNGYIVAWPTVRQLEDMWGYRLNQQDEHYKEGVTCDFQARLFSASIEHAASRSGFSKPLIDVQCQLLQQIIDELPEHQRNYQGLTSRVDQLQWLGMKLLSQARTQAELRDFFGFGGKGKIPKATAKLKFDQYELEHYGYRATDPLPWDAKPTAHRPMAKLSQLDALTAHNTDADKTPVTPLPKVAEDRQILQVKGELAETLFWRHQDLFTVLAADALTCEQIAALMEVKPTKARADIKELLQHGFLQKEGKRFSLQADDLYYKHSHSRLRCLEENLMRYLYAAFDTQNTSVIDNWFLRLPEEGLPLLRQEVLQPFIHGQFLPLSDNPTPVDPEGPYDKRMYALMLLGTHRLSPMVHGRLPLEQRVLYYFREASLQRADRQQQHQAICLRATQMLCPSQSKAALQHVQALRKQLRSYLPHGRGNKPNFNLTLCFTEVPLAFNRDWNPTPVTGNPYDIKMP